MSESGLRSGPVTAQGRAAARRLSIRVAIARATVDARLARTWSQAQLAKAAGVSQADVAELESIRGDPSIERLSQVVRALGLELLLRPATTKGRVPVRQREHVT